MKLLGINMLVGALAALALILLPASAAADNDGRVAESGNINVHVSGLNNSKGVVRIALFNNSDSYSADRGTAANAFKKALAEIKSNESNYTFAAVPYGDYAIKLFHDEDNSGTFYTGMFGIPKVQYGFSNNARAMFGPPSYDKAKFKVNGREVSLDVKVQGN